MIVTIKIDVEIECSISVKSVDEFRSVPVTTATCRVPCETAFTTKVAFVTWKSLGRFPVRLSVLVCIVRVRVGPIWPLRVRKISKGLRGDMRCRTLFSVPTCWSKSCLISFNVEVFHDYLAVYNL